MLDDAPIFYDVRFEPESRATLIEPAMAEARNWRKARPRLRIFRNWEATMGII